MKVMMGRRTLARYFTTMMIGSIARMALAVTMVIVLIDTIEWIRRTAHKANFSAFIIPQLVMMKLPFLLIELSPLILFLGCVAGFTRLARHQEISAARSFGLSLPQLVLPLMMAILVIGIAISLVGQPVAARLMSEARKIEAYLLGSEVTRVSLAAIGIWLREDLPDGRIRMIHGTDLTLQGLRLSRPRILWFGRDGRVERIAYGEAARFVAGQWMVEDATQIDLARKTQTRAELTLTTNMKIGSILSAFAPPETISFWRLPGLIKDFQAAGTTSRAHRMRYYRLCTLPFVLAVMTLLATPVAGLAARAGRTITPIIVGSILACFAIYLFSQTLSSLAVSGQIGVLLATALQLSLPALAGLGLLAHSERHSGS